MGKNRLVHIVEDLEIGGLERVIASIVLGMDRSKYDVEAWCLARGGKIAEEIVDRGVTVKILGMATYHNPLKIIELAKLMRRHNVDIVHAHGYFGSTFGRIAAILARAPVIVTHVHTTYYGFKKRHLIIERCLSVFTDKIICVSQAVKKFVVERERISAQRICVIYNGVGKSFLREGDTDCDADRASLGFNNGDFVVITVASITPHKGHRVLIDAVRRLSKKHDQLRLLIVGDGPLSNELKSYINELGLSSKIVFTGQRKDVASLLRLANVFVLPSTEREGFGIVLVEAMTSCLPLIGTRVGGIPEVIEENVNGFLVTPGNPEELAVAIEKLISDKTVSERMSWMGRKIFEKKFTVAKMTESIESLYDEIIEGRSG